MEACAVDGRSPPEDDAGACNDQGRTQETDMTEACVDTEGDTAFQPRAESAECTVALEQIMETQGTGGIGATASSAAATDRSILSDAAPETMEACAVDGACNDQGRTQETDMTEACVDTEGDTAFQPRAESAECTVALEQIMETQGAGGIGATASSAAATDRSILSDAAPETMEACAVDGRSPPEDDAGACNDQGRTQETDMTEACVDTEGDTAFQPRAESAECTVALEQIMETQGAGGIGATASSAAATAAAVIAGSCRNEVAEESTAPGTSCRAPVAARWSDDVRQCGDAVPNCVAADDALAPPSTVGRAARAATRTESDRPNRVQHSPTTSSAQCAALQGVCELLDTSDDDVAATDDTENNAHLAPLDDSRLTCTICQEWLVYPVTTHCGHSYCKPCLRDYANKSESTDVRRCPQCKAAIGNFCCLNTVDRRMESRLKSRIGSRRYEDSCMQRRGEIEQSHKNIRAFKRTPTQWLPRLRASGSPPALGGSGAHACAGEMDNILAETETSLDQQERIWQQLQARQRLAKDGDIRKEWLAQKAQQEAAHRERLALHCQEDMQIALKLDREEKQQAAAAKRRQEEEDEAMAKRYQEEHNTKKLSDEEQEQAAAAKKRQEEEDEAMAKRYQEEHDKAQTLADEEQEQAAAAKKRQEEEDEAMAKRYQEEHDKAQTLADEEQEQAAAAKKRQEEEDEAMAKRYQEEHDQVATEERVRMQQEAERKSLAVVQALQSDRPKRKASATDTDTGLEHSPTSSSDDDTDDDDGQSFAGARIVLLQPKAKRQRPASPNEVQMPASAAKAVVSQNVAAAPAMSRKEHASVAESASVRSQHHTYSGDDTSSQSQAPAINDAIKGRGIRLLPDGQTEWHHAVLVDWAKGRIEVGEPHAGDLLIHHRWAVCSMILTEKMKEPTDLLVQLSEEKYGRKWTWEEDERWEEGFEERQQRNFDRSEFDCPDVAYTLWRKLKQLQSFWAQETFILEDFTDNHSKFADEWPLIVRSVLKNLLRDHFMMEARLMIRFKGTVALTLGDVRLDTEHDKGVYSQEEGWAIWKVSDLTRLMRDVASRIDGPLVQWPEGGVERWISRLEADVNYDVERHNGHAISNFCSGCLRVADPDGTPIDLCVHPMFDNLFMCDGCKSNYENEGNWVVSLDGEEACRCCGFELRYEFPLVRCDTCTACFCHNCINGQCPQYGAAEFKAIEESADANAPPWRCFLCRPQALSVLKVNKEALRRFRSKEADQRPSRRASASRSVQKVYIRLDVDSDDSGDDSDDEEVTYKSDPSESEGDENGVDSQNEQISAAAVGPRRTSTGVRAPRNGGQRRQVRRKVPDRVFERTVGYMKPRSRHEPYILIENVKGMSTHDRKTIQEALHLDMTLIDSVRFSFATRKRLYFANFECLPESELPTLDGSPVMSKELETAIPNQDEMLAYFEDQVIDSRFIETGATSHNETPFDKTLCIMPDKGEDLVVAGLNDKLRAIARSGFDTTKVPKLNQEDVKKMRKFNMILTKDDRMPYLQLRLLTVAEREKGMGFEPLPNGRLWTHAARSEKIAWRQLGDSFEVRTIVWRLQTIHRELVERCKREQRPLRVLSICDGIAGCLAALNRLGGFEYGITYVAIEKNRDARRVVECNCDLFPLVELIHIPKCSDAENKRECLPRCHCGDVLSMRAHDKCGLNDPHMLLSYLENQSGGTIDLCMSGYPCKGHSSANREGHGNRNRAGRIGHDSQTSGDTWWAVQYMLQVLCHTHDA